MAETEVETILREIRERVLSQERAGQDLAAMTNGGNGAGEFGSSQRARPGDNESPATGNLSLINSYLTTTARSWDRLPPVLSNRSGFLARVELWFKRRLRTGTRWFTWEQVNFNAAVHHALRDLLPVLLANDAELRKIRAQLADSEAQLTDVRAREDQVNAQLAGLVNELRERDAHLRDEQRVCFKQLALETTEAAVLEDRARRKTEALLAELARRMEQLEKRKSDES